MKKKFLDLKLKCRYIIQGFKTRKEFHINDIVGYKGKEYFISNANKTDNKGIRIYKLVENVPYDKNGYRNSIELKEFEIYKVKCWSNFKRGMFNIYDFNMMYWHDSNLRKLINK